jgi:hypothetical protein
MDHLGWQGDIMKQYYVGFFLLLGLFVAGEAMNAVAQDQKFTCQVYGGLFVLDDNDFKALGEHDKKITRQNFGSLTQIPESKSATAENFGV